MNKDLSKTGANTPVLFVYAVRAVACLRADLSTNSLTDLWYAISSAGR
ncbi:MAG: hypothetical protein Q4E54_02615 [Lachnospiraceae bacterium]|nr:hypothetical protein [Lachnospiraceae bacterium]